MLSRSNYEIYFVDYADGKLTPAQQRELFAFLDQHPDLKEEFELFNSVDVPVETVKIKYENKDSLKKGVVSTEQLIAFFENDLSLKERQDVQVAMDADRQLQREYELIASTVLKPDKTVIYKNKHQLKRGVLISMHPAVKQFTAVAASLVILIAAYFILFDIKQDNSFTADKSEKSTLTPSKDKIADREEVVVPAEKENDLAETAIDDKKNYRAEKARPEIKSENVAEQKQSLQSVQPSLPEKLVVNDPVPSPVAPSTIISPTSDQSIAAAEQIEKARVLRDEQVKAELADIFSKDDMAELKNMGGSDRRNTQNGFEVLAKKLENATDIKVRTTENVAEDSKTFALAVGKKFTFSRTKSK